MKVHHEASTQPLLGSDSCLLMHVEQRQLSGSTQLPATEHCKRGCLSTECKQISATCSSA